MEAPPQAFPHPACGWTFSWIGRDETCRFVQRFLKEAMSDMYYFICMCIQQHLVLNTKNIDLLFDRRREPSHSMELLQLRSLRNTGFLAFIHALRASRVYFEKSPPSNDSCIWATFYNRPFFADEPLLLSLLLRLLNTLVSSPGLSPGGHP